MGGFAGSVIHEPYPQSAQCTPEDLAREFEPSAQTIRNWVVQAERDEGRRVDGPSSAEGEELRRVRREIHRLCEERDILAKATAWFTRETVPGRSRRRKKSWIENLAFLT